jgi:hypothetical protein
MLFVLATAFSCSDTYTLQQTPVPVHTTYLGVFEVSRTSGSFVTGQIPNTPLEAGNYKIVVFPSALELKSYYVKADAQGNIAVEYKLDKSFDVEPGHDGVIFGIIQIINVMRNNILDVPVGYLP